MRSYLALSREVDREELFEREKGSRNFLEKRRLMAIRLRSDGKTPPEVCDILGVHQCSLRNWVNAYNKNGFKGLEPREKQSGPKRRLSRDQAKVVCGWLDEGPVEHQGCHFWTGKRLAASIEETFGIKYSENGIYKLLKYLGYTRLVPKTRHYKSDPAAAEEFKKNFPQWSRQ